MVEKILEWLKKHKDDLQDIDYADDVDLRDSVGLYHTLKRDYDGLSNVLEKVKQMKTSCKTEFSVKFSKST